MLIMENLVVNCKIENMLFLFFPSLTLIRVLGLTQAGGHPLRDFFCCHFEE